MAMAPPCSPRRSTSESDKNRDRYRTTELARRSDAKDADPRAVDVAEHPGIDSRDLPTRHHYSGVGRTPSRRLPVAQDEEILGVLQVVLIRRRELR